MTVLPAAAAAASLHVAVSTVVALPTAIRLASKITASACCLVRTLLVAADCPMGIVVRLLVVSTPYC